jgi:antitoxin ParD1/3/4
MPDRQTMNVSLPPAQEQFVRDQVASGRYQTASEVLRDGLRLLEREEWQRLLQKDLVEGLTDQERARVPEHVWEKVRAYFDKALKEARESGYVDGPTAMEAIRQKVLGRKRRKSA